MSYSNGPSYSQNQNSDNGSNNSFDEGNLAKHTFFKKSSMMSFKTAYFRNDDRTVGMISIALATPQGNMDWNNRLNFMVNASELAQIVHACETGEAKVMLTHKNKNDNSQPGRTFSMNPDSNNPDRIWVNLNKGNEKRGTYLSCQLGELVLLRELAKTVLTQVLTNEKP